MERSGDYLAAHWMGYSDIKNIHHFTCLDFEAHNVNLNDLYRNRSDYWSFSAHRPMLHSSGHVLAHRTTRISRCASLRRDSHFFPFYYFGTLDINLEMNDNFKWLHSHSPDSASFGF